MVRYRCHWRYRNLKAAVDALNSLKYHMIRCRIDGKAVSIRKSARKRPKYRVVNGISRKYVGTRNYRLEISLEVNEIERPGRRKT